MMKREEEIRALSQNITNHLKAGDITWTWNQKLELELLIKRAEEISDVLRNQSLEVTSVTSKEKNPFARVYL